jgi:predicted RNase H-like nuclease
VPATYNDDNGSLFVGGEPVEIGSTIQIDGEPRPRTVTYVIHSAKGNRTCFRGQGAVPIGEISWNLVAVTTEPDLHKPRTQTAANAGPAGLRTAAPENHLRSSARDAFVPTAGGPVVLSGFDSAWGRSARGAFASIRSGAAGWSLLGPASVDWREVYDVTREYCAGASAHIIAVDQPLIVRNATGSRPVEAAVRPTIGRFGGAVQPASHARAELFGPAAPIWEFLANVGGAIDPDRVPHAYGERFLFEVFPALGNLGLFRDSYARGRCFKYNPDNDTFSITDWRAICQATAMAFAALPCCQAAKACADLSRAMPNKTSQDFLDSLICILHAHSFWTRGSLGNLIVGDVKTGYIVVPAHPALAAELAANANIVGVPCRGAGIASP